MKNDKPEWLISKSKFETEEDVWLYDIDIKLLQLDARGFEEEEAAKWLNLKYKCAHKHFGAINDKTGAPNAKARVGWAFQYGVLIVVDRVIVIAPAYTIDNDNEMKE